MHKAIPAISLDTVYRTLRLFEEKAVLARISAGRDRVRLDANMAQHHHFVCTVCGLVRDFYDEQFNGLKAPRVVQDPGAVNSVYVELLGLCRECRKS